MNATTAIAPQRPALSAASAGFLQRPKQLLINNRWTDAQSGARIPVENPALGEVIVEVAAAGAADVELAVAAARTAFKRWSTQQPSMRARLLFKLADLLERHAGEFAELESLDVGKPLMITRMLDVPFTVDAIRYNAGWATKLTGETFDLACAPTPFQAFSLRQPVGVVAGIVPWNFPLLQMAMKVSAALAAGCVIVLKPSELTPLSALRLGELALEAGFPPGVLQILTGLGSEAGAALVRHPGVDKISFTGSTAVGRDIVRSCAEDFKRVTVELGGKSPNIIFADADLEQAIAGSAAAAFFNAGQVCYAGTRLYVQDSVYDTVVAGLAEAMANYVIGDPFDAETQLGPLVSARQRERVEGYVDEGVRAGAEIVAGGRRVDRQGYFVEPTLLAKTDPAMRVIQEEIFGPVVCVVPFKNFADVVAQANGTRYGLAAGVWSRDVKNAHRAARAIHAGTVWVNCYHVVDPNMPFGGWRESGWGREFGRAGVESFTELKSVALKL
ncbi:aldehyde dehydrogenase (acceptor) [Tahibacter aquaticus]|uniref:Aldehyde dehydrogenase (Acceptor) n=1 Tax=Tahibacter aquaticus TaxID=520092 RepID=A0A4R6Z000_9GAMM|nr:aldehyde dehydrogenase family protein [Tahibacter aquaticus]TDR44830.1 aldehyde dehydrogenase (acceptor) [Tahibacter aquaticus]